MENKTQIKTTKTIYPQIYAYTLPEYPNYNGWIKIGYTERKDVHKRIKEQTKTAAIEADYMMLWSEPAQNSNHEWFKDTHLHAYLRKYKKVQQWKNKEWFYYNGEPNKAYQDFLDFRNNNYIQNTDKQTYTLRLEQELAVSKTIEYIKGHPGGKFLWNAKPRFGKTLTTYDLAIKLDVEKVLIVTNRPAIANSWFDDFEKFIAWQSRFAFVSTSDSLKDRKSMSRDEWVKQLSNKGAKEGIISFISLQDLKGAISFGGKYDKLNWVKDINWDLLVIDESHEGVDTLKTDIAFDKISRNFTLHLSGTPFKAVGSGVFKENQIFNWTYADEQESKKEWEDKEINNPYDKLPRLNMFSYQMSDMITDQVNKGADIEGGNIDFAFDLNEFFETNESGKFIHESEIIKWLDTLTRNEKYPFSTKNLRNELKHTFWLLNRVASAKALKRLLEDHPVFDNYKIILAAGNGRSNDDDQTINQKSIDRVKKAISESDKTITLSVGQLTTGVTIPEWTAVVMLSNMKSPSLYMQAAFRAQNPWEFERDGEIYKKENAYVFDFAPERTLTIYDEFANNLSSNTTNGGGTTNDRKNNVRRLLNFFPVIAEDIEGKMVELDASQVLTIPKAIKAREVVKRGFMSNLLFQNVGGIFGSSGAREILEHLNPVDKGKINPRTTDEEIDTKGIQLDDDGEVSVNTDIVIAKTKAHFGEKLYESIQKDADENLGNHSREISKAISDSYIENTSDTLKEFAKENGLSAKAAQRVVRSGASAIEREIEVVQRNSNIELAEAKAEYKKKVAESKNDDVKVAEAKKLFEEKEKEINDELKRDIANSVKSKTKEIAQQSTETILKQAEEKKKTTVEEDVRARLRGFARTIPSFLMAYGHSTTTLYNFDTSIKDEVFKEVTGINLEQFRILRDKYNFFDKVVFDESVQEFLKKRQDLANYFDENQEEDIFDYIPPQQTNQIYTPKKVVKIMVDKLQEENPDDFTDPQKTFADLYMKSGLYITEIVKRLYIGLENKIPNPEDRLKHILENQVYGFAPTEIIYNIARNFIFGFDDRGKNIDDTHIVHLDTIPFAQGKGNFEKKCEELFGGKTNEI